MAGLLLPNQSSFHRLESKLFGVRLIMHEGPGTDDSKKSQIRLHPV